MADSQRPSIVVLVGPTAVGKTAATAALCGWFNAEVISADSVAVYCGLDIGSAKPTPQEQALTSHHLIDVVDPSDDFSVADFARLADGVIADLHGMGKRALVAGGTGLYVKALLHGLAEAPEVDQELRARLADEWQAKGKQAMHQRLAELDPEAAARIHPSDRQRVLRALEVIEQTGLPFSHMQKDHGFAGDRYPHLLLGLNRERAELFSRIEQRCEEMFESGLIAEVKGLLANGVSPEAKSLGALGYRQVVKMLGGEYDQSQALAETIRKTKAYAKRQWTWFNKVPEINWLHPDDLGKARELVERWWKDE